MKKKISLVLAVVMLMAVLAVAALAAGETNLAITYADKSGEATGLFTADLVVTSPKKIQTCYVKITFNNEKMTIADCFEYIALDAQDAGYCIDPYYDRRAGSYILQSPSLQTTGTKSTLEFTLYTMDEFDYSEGFTIGSIYFLFKGTNNKASLAAGDFVIESTYLGDSDEINYVYNFEATGTTVDIVPTQDVAPEAPKFPSNAFVMTDEFSVRADDTMTGVRFKGSFLTSLKTLASEYGYLLAVESAKAALPAGYEVNKALLDEGKAVKGVAFNTTGIDIFYDVADNRTIVTAVLTGVPMTKEAVTATVAVRPYAIYENNYFYGDTVKTSPYEVASAIKEAGGAAYEDNQEYIDAIIALVPSTSGNDTDIDASYLFED